jgi:predicted ATPase
VAFINVRYTESIGALLWARQNGGRNMIDHIRLQNLLSFGDEGSEIKLEPLNVIIGTNGSGKSNFLEVFNLLRNAPSDISKPIREGGGVVDWLYKGNKNNKKSASISIIVDSKALNTHPSLIYTLSFMNNTSRFEIVNERIAFERPNPNNSRQGSIYNFNNDKPLINIRIQNRLKSLELKDIDTTQSILAQKRDAYIYPEITFLADEFSRIRIYRDWVFGRDMPPRFPQKVDLKNDFLDRDCSNLCMVLNHLRNDLSIKKKLLKELQSFYADVEDYEITFAGGQAQIFFQERGLRSSVPATRLSDGTLRYLCLLSILCHPNPPRLICIDEPELGMHPDIIPNLARLLLDASERCQLIVTTHSEILIDAFTETPEVVLVTEKDDDGTHFERLDRGALKPWLDKYRLGNLWSRGDIGGSRWSSSAATYLAPHQ